MGWFGIWLLRADFGAERVRSGHNLECHLGGRTDGCDVLLPCSKGHRHGAASVIFDFFKVQLSQLSAIKSIISLMIPGSSKYSPSKSYQNPVSITFRLGCRGVARFGLLLNYPNLRFSHHYRHRRIVLSVSGSLRCPPQLIIGAWPEIARRNSFWSWIDSHLFRPAGFWSGEAGGCNPGFAMLGDVILDS